jgi:hypothetical protein
MYPDSCHLGVSDQTDGQVVKLFSMFNERLGLHKEATREKLQEF